MYIIIPIFSIAFILFMWNCSDIVNLMANITQTHEKFKINKYNQFKENGNFFATYAEFLYITYPSWKTKLISCNICLCFWFTVISSFILMVINKNIFLTISIFPVIYMLSMLLFLITSKLYNSQ